MIFPKKEFIIGGTATTSPFLIGSIARKLMLYHSTNSNAPIIEPPKHLTPISVLVCTYNEEFTIETTLKSIKDQNIIKKFPELFEIWLVDSNSKDKTIELANPYVHKIITTPKGKLTSRNIATKLANGKIIISADGDTYYPPNLFNILLKHFHNPNVVAVTGHALHTDINPLEKSLEFFWHLYDCTLKYKPVLYGRNSAFLKETFLKVGGFDESVDQYNVKTMRIEEEHLFPKRLSQHGKVILDWQATCMEITSRRYFCFLRKIFRKIPLSLPLHKLQKTKSCPEKCPFSAQCYLCKYFKEIETKERF